MCMPEPSELGSPERGYLIGIDVGTSFVKTVLLDLEGNELFVAGERNEIESIQPGWAEQDMMLLWEITKKTVRAVMSRSAIPPGAVIAVGITGQGDGTWLIGQDGEPVRRALIWLDGRTGEAVARWHADGTNHEVFEQTGTVLTPGHQSSQLYWLDKVEPESLAKAKAVLHAKDWIFFKFTRQVTTDESEASYTFFDIRNNRYSDRIFEILGLERWRHLIPPARPSCENVGELEGDVARETGLLPGTPVAAGPVDVAATAIGAGALYEGDGCSVIGTAGIHQIVMDEPLTEPPDVGYTLCYGPPGKWLRMLPTMTCTSNLEWFIRNFCGEDLREAKRLGVDLWDHMEQLAERVPVGSEGIIYHPYIDPAGERVPFVKPSARAQFSGLSAFHTRHHLLRAVYEGVALSALDCYSYMPKEINGIRLAGGGAKSKFWARMFADVTGKVTRTLVGTEFGAKGAAINAGVAVGAYRSFGDALERTVKVSREYHPAPERTERYRRIYEVYREMYRLMWGIWDR